MVSLINNFLYIKMYIVIAYIGYTIDGITKI